MKTHSIVHLLSWSIHFWQKHVGPIMVLMLIAAIGRAWQMRAFGGISSTVYVSLEVMVELARIVALAVIVGHGHIRRGFLRMGALFTLSRSEWAEFGRIAKATVRNHWPTLLAAILLLGIIGFIINKTNDLIATNLVVQQTLRQYGLLDPEATAMPIAFFLKNLTIIPFTLIFEYGLLRWCLRQSLDIRVTH